MADPFLTIAGSFVASVIALLLTNAISGGWRASTITTDIRGVITVEVNGLHTKIDEMAVHLRAHIDNGLRDIDKELKQHFRDDVISFAETRRETGEMGHALREKLTTTELWNRDNFLLVKHFDNKAGVWDSKFDSLISRLEQQDRVSDARHETALASVNEARDAASGISKRLDIMEKNGKL